MREKIKVENKILFQILHLQTTKRFFKKMKIDNINLD